MSLDTCCNNCYANRDNDRHKVDVSKNSKLGESWWDCQNEEQDGTDYRPNKGANSRLVDDADPGYGSGQGMRSHDEYQEEYEHHTTDLVADPAKEKADTVRITGEGIVSMCFPQHCW